MSKAKTNLFVIGNPRSGTSLLRIMLNSHKDIIVPPECGFIQWWYKKYSDWPKEHTIDDFIMDLRASKKIETWQLDYDALKSFLQTKNSNTYSQLVFNVIAFYGFSNFKNQTPKVLGDKNNYYIDHLNLLKEISPKAKYLLILRDPKDIYCSYKNIIKLNTTSKYKPNLSKNVDEFINDWLQNQTKILEFFKSLKKEQFFITQYQNLILDTKNELIKVCNFLGLDFDEQMLLYYLSNDEPQDFLDWKKKTLQPLDQKSLGRFRRELTQREIDLIDKETREVFNSNLKLGQA